MSEAASQHRPDADLRERAMFPMSGWLALLVGIGLLAFAAIQLIDIVRSRADTTSADTSSLGPGLWVAVASLAVGVFVLNGLFTLEPNQAVVLTFFGAYRGTVRADGLRWVAPFYRRSQLSLRLQNLNGEVLKVNDHGGNPIEISAVVVWYVGDTARARFGVEDYRRFVDVQSESAVRELAGSYPYDGPTGGGVETLRGGGDAINDALRSELQARLDPSGVIVAEARVNHLAYAPEIAQAMLRRQQAKAIIDARARIVDGAVGIARDAVARLRTDGGIELSGDREAGLVGSLMVVLCSDTEVVPTIGIQSPG